MCSSRIISVDIARAIAIILVVSRHFIPDGMPEWYSFLQYNVLSFIRLPLFMFVSGYLYIHIERERERKGKIVKYGTFVWHKFKRLMVPYFFVSALIITLKLLTQGEMYVERPTSISSFYEMFYISTTVAYFLWFAYGLFLIFLIIPFFNTSKKLIIITIIALVIYFIPVNFPDIFSLAAIKSKFIFFCLGCIVANHNVLRNLPTKIGSWQWLFVFIFLCVSLLYLPQGILRSFVGLLTSVTGVMLALSFSELIGKFSGKITKLLLVVSTCSYSIYLFHTTFMGFAKSILMRLLHGNMAQNELTFIVSAFIVILAGVTIPILLQLFVARHSKIVSFLIGTKFLGKRPALGKTK